MSTTEYEKNYCGDCNKRIEDDIKDNAIYLLEKAIEYIKGNGGRPCTGNQAVRKLIFNATLEVRD